MTADLRLGPYQAQIEEAGARLAAEGWLARLAAGDPTLWRAEPMHHQVIRARLGWVTVPARMREQVEALRRFADEVRGGGFTHALVLGMGGSSLFPAVCRRTFGVARGALDLVVLDTTDPATVLRTRRMLPLARTLCVVSTKSGTTTETLAFLAYVEEQLRAEGVDPARHLVAITDPGTPLAETGQARGFRRVFLNDPTVGGRFSALSYFGLVPAALLGVDIGLVLDRVQPLVEACGRAGSLEDSPGVTLGVTLGTLARVGRDKLTLWLSRPVASFGGWLEQLIAESSGKNGRGIVPVEGEPLGAPAVYGPDRVFVTVELPGVDDASVHGRLDALAAAGHPVVRCRMQDRFDLGAQCFLWERATAVACAVLGVNPFDEPNVKAAKDSTTRLLQGYARAGRFPEETPELIEGAVRVFTGGERAGGTVGEVLQAFLRGIGAGEYLAVLLYLPETPAGDRVVQELRGRWRDRLRVPVTVGYGPRYLHSTGQLHKGGAATGRFVLITAEEAEEVPIPGAGHTFGTLQRAQALGDVQALQAAGRRVLRLHLTGDLVASLRRVSEAIGPAASGRHPSGGQAPPQAGTARTWVKLGIFIGLVGGIGWGLQALGPVWSQLSPERFRSVVLSFGAWAPLVYLAAYGQPLVPLPASVMTITGGLAFGPVWGTLAALAGATLRACGEFGVARVLGRETVAKLLRGKVAALDQRIGAHGFGAVLLIRLIPNLPFDVQNYGLGFSRVRFVPYAAATILGMLPGSVLFVFLGYSLTDPRHLWKLVLALVLIVAVMAGQRVWVRRRGMGQA